MRDVDEACWVSEAGIQSKLVTPFMRAKLHCRWDTIGRETRAVEVPSTWSLDPTKVSGGDARKLASSPAQLVNISWVSRIWEAACGMQP